MSSKIAEVTQLREQMLKAAKAIVKAGAISRSGHGNMSVQIPKTKSMLLTSVSNLDNLTPEMLPLVTFDGKVLDGQLEATSAEIVGQVAPELLGLFGRHGGDLVQDLLANLRQSGEHTAL